MPAALRPGYPAWQAAPSSPTGRTHRPAASPTACQAGGVSLHSLPGLPRPLQTYWVPVRHVRRCCHLPPPALPSGYLRWTASAPGRASDCRQITCAARQSQNQFAVALSQKRFVQDLPFNRGTGCVTTSAFDKSNNVCDPAGNWVRPRRSCAQLGASIPARADVVRGG